MFRVEQIDHVELFVPDRYAAAGWYQQVFGLEIVKPFEHWAADPRGPLMISSDSGSTKLALFQGEPPGKRNTIGFRRVAFRVDAAGFEAFLKRLAIHPVHDEHGQPLSWQSVVDHDVSWSLYFVDPWGNPYEVTTYDYDAVAALLRQ